MSDAFNQQLSDLESVARTQKLADEAMDAIASCRAKLVLGKDARSVFFATVAMKLRVELPAAGEDVPTMATDGRRLLFSPEFVAGMSREELIGVIAHEVLHCTNCHHVRRKSRDPQGWNIACDLAINCILRDCKFTLPAGALYPAEGVFAAMPAGLSAEEYYALLPTVEIGGAGGGGADPGGCGGVLEPGKGEPAAMREAEADAKILTAQAEQAASKMPGGLPGSLVKAIETTLQATIDWRDVLREFVSRRARNNYSWVQPNRRFIGSGLYLPGLHSEELGEVVLLVDVSGSITEELLESFAAEVQGILETYDTQLTILYHDTEVQLVETWRTSDGPLKLTHYEGGGTSHIPAFAEIERQGLSPVVVVCLTDLFSSFPEVEPPYPTLWCVNGNPNGVGPFGQTVHIKPTN